MKKKSNDGLVDWMMRWWLEGKLVVGGWVAGWWLGDG